MTQNTQNNVIKNLSKRDFLKMIGGMFAFVSLGGIGALIKNFKGFGKNTETKIASQTGAGFGKGGYGV